MGGGRRRFEYARIGDLLGQAFIFHRADGPHPRLLDFLSSKWAWLICSLFFRVNDSEHIQSKRTKAFIKTEYRDAGSDLQGRDIGFGAAGRKESDPYKFRTSNVDRIHLQRGKPLRHQSLLSSTLLPSQTVPH